MEDAHKFKQKPAYCLISFNCIILILFYSQASIKLVQSNPIPFGSSALPLIAIPPGAFQMASNPFQASPATLMMAADSHHHYDPYSVTHAAAALTAGPYYMPAFAAPWTQPVAMDSNQHRRSLPVMFGSGGGASGSTNVGSNKAERSSGGQDHRQRDRGNQNEEPSDEQKALDGLPLSFIEPDPPSTITERLSESFSALGEGVKNHFRSMSENFSDTMDDIRDAWRPAQQSNGNNNDNVSRKRRSRIV